MGRSNLSTQEIFLRLGATPRARSARADQLFRRLRNGADPAQKEIVTTPPQKMTLKTRRATEDQRDD